MGKIILITGASSGFGRLTAQTLAMAGHTIYASMRNVGSTNRQNAEHLSSWAQEEGYNLKVVNLDVTNTIAAGKLVNEISAEVGSLDVLINNAGHGSMGITEDFTMDFVRQQFEANVFGVFNMTKAVIPVMKKAREGLIITLSSGMGRMIVPTLHVYCASKFAVEALAEGWRYELAPLGIDSVIVEPGAFPTTNFMNAAYANSPQQSGKIADYGSLKNFLEGFAAHMQESIKNGTANNPQDVANAIKELIETPQGSRPMRTVVDKNNAQLLNDLNRETDNIQAHLLQPLQLGDRAFLSHLPD